MTNYVYKTIFLKKGDLWSISGFGIIYKVCFYEVYLNAASCQTADSTVSICTSKEPELKGLKRSCNSQVLKKCEERAQQTKIVFLQFL